MTASIAKARGIVWSDSTERIYLPVAKAGDNVGWVVRGFNPKYYRASGKDIFGYYISDNVINNGKIVIVEDLLSAWKCSQVVDSIALLGTNIKPQVVKEILERNYKDAYIFLDGDNPQVRMKARKIAKRLLTLNTTVLETGNDPKYLDVTTIEGMIK